jgi:hypothetical protein
MHKHRREVQGMINIYYNDLFPGVSYSDLFLHVSLSGKAPHTGNNFYDIEGGGGGGGETEHSRTM